MKKKYFYTNLINVIYNKNEWMNVNSIIKEAKCSISSFYLRKLLNSLKEDYIIKININGTTYYGTPTLKVTSEYKLYLLMQKICNELSPNETHLKKFLKISLNKIKNKESKDISIYDFLSYYNNYLINYSEKIFDKILYTKKILLEDLKKYFDKKAKKIFKFCIKKNILKSVEFLNNIFYYHFSKEFIVNSLKKIIKKNSFFKYYKSLNLNKKIETEIENILLNYNTDSQILLSKIKDYIKTQQNIFLDLTNDLKKQLSEPLYTKKQLIKIFSKNNIDIKFLTEIKILKKIFFINKYLYCSTDYENIINIIKSIKVLFKKTLLKISKKQKKEIIKKIIKLIQTNPSITLDEIKDFIQQQIFPVKNLKDQISEWIITQNKWLSFEEIYNYAKQIKSISKKTMENTLQSILKNDNCIIKQNQLYGHKFLIKKDNNYLYIIPTDLNLKNCWDALYDYIVKAVNFISRKKGLQPYESDELLQLAYLHFVKLHKIYNPFHKKGRFIPYKYYMLNQIKRRIYWELQKYFYKQNKEIPGGLLVLNSNENIENNFTENTLSELLFEVLSKEFKEKELKALILLSEGYSYKEIYEILKIKKKEVIIMKEKVKNFLLDKKDDPKFKFINYFINKQFSNTEIISEDYDDFENEKYEIYDNDIEKDWENDTENFC